MQPWSRKSGSLSLSSPMIRSSASIRDLSNRQTWRAHSLILVCCRISPLIDRQHIAVSKSHFNIHHQDNYANNGLLWTTVTVTSGDDSNPCLWNRAVRRVNYETPSYSLHHQVKVQKYSNYLFTKKMISPYNLWNFA